MADFKTVITVPPVVYNVKGAYSVLAVSRRARLLPTPIPSARFLQHSESTVPVSKGAGRDQVNSLLSLASASMGVN